MNITPVAYRYARSLMELAEERGQLDDAHVDMALVARICFGNRDLMNLLKSPVINADKKERVLDQVFAGNIGEMTARFIGILVRKGREALLPEVAHAFGDLYRAHRNITVCEVSSATPLNEENRLQVKALVEKKYPGTTITLTEKVDPSLIGGVVVRVGDEQYDGSVSRRLNDLRRKFSENPYIPEL